MRPSWAKLFAKALAKARSSGTCLRTYCATFQCSSLGLLLRPLLQAPFVMRSTRAPCRLPVSGCSEPRCGAGGADLGFACAAPQARAGFELAGGLEAAPLRSSSAHSFLRPCSIRSASSAAKPRLPLPQLLCASHYRGDGVCVALLPFQRCECGIGGRFGLARRPLHLPCLAG